MHAYPVLYARCIPKCNDIRGALDMICTGYDLKLFRGAYHMNCGARCVCTVYDLRILNSDWGPVVAVPRSFGSASRAERCRKNGVDARE
jgi:hypothetical protein